ARARHAASSVGSICRHIEPPCVLACRPLAVARNARPSPEGALMAEFVQQVVAGLGDGAIYASLALALVLIYRSTHVINFAQGEMGMVSTYLAWALITHHGWSYWPA